jgi:hypothetical protein
MTSNITFLLEQSYRSNAILGIDSNFQFPHGGLSFTLEAVQKALGFIILNDLSQDIQIPSAALISSSMILML